MGGKPRVVHPARETGIVVEVGLEADYEDYDCYDYDYDYDYDNGGDLSRRL